MKPKERALRALAAWRARFNPCRITRLYSPHVLQQLRLFQHRGLRFALELEAGETVASLARKLKVDHGTVLEPINRFCAHFP